MGDGVTRGGVRALVRRVAIDVTPLRVSRDFRLLWIGLLISEAGYHFTLIAIFIQVARLTDDEAAVGLTGLFGLVGLVAGSLTTASFVDAHDRRMLLILAQVGFMAASGLLLAGAIAGDPPLWLIYLAVPLIR